MTGAECKYFPFAPYEVPKTDPVGLKACIFDNTEDRLVRLTWFFNFI